MSTEAFSHRMHEPKLGWTQKLIMYFQRKHAEREYEKMIRSLPPEILRDIGLADEIPHHGSSAEDWDAPSHWLRK